MQREREERQTERKSDENREVQKRVKEEKTVKAVNRRPMSETKDGETLKE